MEKHFGNVVKTALCIVGGVAMISKGTHDINRWGTYGVFNSDSEFAFFGAIVLVIGVFFGVKTLVDIIRDKG